MTQLLDISALSVGYGARPVIADFAFAMDAGERVALIGPNGCGKSTLLRAVMAEIVESQGRILHHGVNIASCVTDAVVRRGIGYLRQTRNIFSGLTVRENLDLAAWGNGENRKTVMEAFTVLQGRESVRAGLLSGGERQALAVAMALMRRLSLLLLDEPVAGLSPKNAVLILEGIARLQKQRGFAVLMVEHRLKLIAPHVDRVIVMVGGKIQEDTKDTTILTDQRRLERHYLL